MNRDIDDYPEDLDEEGDASHDGDAEWVILTAFSDGVADSGKVWIIPAYEEERANVLLTGLDQPLSACFDISNDFLYVCD
jgi:hypothetical protein